jgi:hypothetical protein
LEIQKYVQTNRFDDASNGSSYLNRLNNTLQFFPLGTKALKLSDAEIIGLLEEWSLPPQWRAKFDLDGYMPALHPRSRLLKETQHTKKRRQRYRKRAEKTTTRNGKTKMAQANARKVIVLNNKNYYCSKHGEINSCIHRLLHH